MSMSENGSLGLHLSLEDIECTALEGSRAVVRLRGSWRGERRDTDSHTVLIVEADGHRHRFPALPSQPRPRQTGFTARFELPVRLVSALGRSGSVAVGEHRAGLPKLTGLPSMMFDDNDNGDAPGDAGGDAPDVDAELGRLTEAPAAASPGTPESGLPPAGGTPPSAGQEPEGPGGEEPLSTAETSLIELREALRRRATTEAQLRGELADLRAELSGRSAAGERFDEMREALRTELERVADYKRRADARRDEIESRAMVLAAELADTHARARELEAERDALAAQLREGRSEIQAARAAAEASAAEVTTLHAELGRLEGELTAARTALHQRESGIQEAESLLSQARALTAELKED